MTTDDGSSVLSVAFSPDGKTLAAGDFGAGQIALWDVADPGRPRQLTPFRGGDGSSVISVAFSPDGRTLAADDNDGQVTLWDAADPGQPQQLGTPLTVGDGSSVHSVV